MLFSWTCAALSIAFGLAGVVFIFRSVKAHWNVQVCPTCSYDLRGRPDGSSRCPECGTTPQSENTSVIERRPGYLLLGFVLLVVAMFLIVAAFFIPPWPI